MEISITLKERCYECPRDQENYKGELGVFYKSFEHLVQDNCTIKKELSKMNYMASLLTK